MTNAKYNYWKRKRNGLCVSCGLPFEGEVTRCPMCMKKQSAASVKSNRKRAAALKAKAAEVDALRARVAELEAML